MAKANMKRIASSAANYRQEGLSQKKAMQKAWDDERSRQAPKKPQSGKKEKSLFERLFGS
ncbi:MAG: hypothetical protein ACK4UP_02405 [Spirosomataceae bacterium]